MLVDIGNVIIHPTGTNPYSRTVENPYAIGDQRVKLLQSLRDGGEMPAGYSLWNGRERKPITDHRAEVDWSGVRK